MASIPFARRRLLALASAVVAAFAACDRPPFFRPEPPTAHERYARSLDDAGLTKSALGRDWLTAAQRALRSPVPARLPFREAGYFAASEAAAVGYALSLTEGERLVADIETQGPTFTLFADVFRVTGDTTEPFRHEASTDSTSKRVVLEIDRTGTYIVRLQPELLRSGRYMLTLRVEPTLAFPVSGGDEGAVKSYFGVSRDAGRRRHHGIDIFAPRGTPVVAATEGYVSSISPNELGGNVVWLRDSRGGRTLYYAHLDRHAIAAGAQVRAGDTLGFVGNTGNAGTTSPHLHFGVYRRGQGPLDPFPFVRRSRTPVPTIVADTSRLGRLVRTTIGDTRLISAPGRDSTVRAIEGSTPLRVEAAAGGWFRVRLPDGTSGYLLARATESMSAPVQRTRVAVGTPIRDGPRETAAVVATTTTADALAVIGRYERYVLVETRAGVTGWVTLD